MKIAIIYTKKNKWNLYAKKVPYIDSVWPKILHLHEALIRFSSILFTVVTTNIHIYVLYRIIIQRTLLHIQRPKFL